VKWSNFNIVLGVQSGAADNNQPFYRGQKLPRPNPYLDRVPVRVVDRATKKVKFLSSTGSTGIVSLSKMNVGDIIQVARVGKPIIGQTFIDFYSFPVPNSNELGPVTGILVTLGPPKKIFPAPKPIPSPTPIIKPAPIMKR